MHNLVTTMKKATFAILSVVLLSACSEREVSTSSAAANQASSVAQSPDVVLPTTAKLQSPIQIRYRVIGEPLVGQPTAIELSFSSTLGARPFDVAYRINDSTALRLPDDQLDRVAVSPSLDENAFGFAAQQVTVVPLREGRLYLNVAAEIETESGSFSSVTAVPVEVGSAPIRREENGAVMTDENGELVRSLPGRTN